MNSSQSRDGSNSSATLEKDHFPTVFNDHNRFHKAMVLKVISCLGHGMEWNGIFMDIEKKNMLNFHNSSFLALEFPRVVTQFHG